MLFIFTFRIIIIGTMSKGIFKYLINIIFKYILYFYFNIKLLCRYYSMGILTSYYITDNNLYNFLKKIVTVLKRCC